MAKRRTQRKREEQEPPGWKTGWEELAQQPVLSRLMMRTMLRPLNGMPRTQWVSLDASGIICLNADRGGSPSEWFYALAHALLHLGHGHHLMPADADPLAYNLACDLAIQNLLHAVGSAGWAPQAYRLPPDLPRVSVRDYSRLLSHPGLKDYQHWSGGGDLLPGGKPLKTPGSVPLSRADWQALLAAGLREHASQAIDQAAGAGWRESGSKSQARLILTWFMANFPLLSSLAAGFRLVEDEAKCRALDIEIAAVNPIERIIYINPRAGLSEEELRFVIAHEVLHVALLHHQRLEGRDPLLWNVSCFPPGTHTGWGKPIEEVATMVSPYDGELVIVNSQASQVKATLEHPFYVRRKKHLRYPIELKEPEWLKADELDPATDYVLVPKLKETVRDVVIDLEPYISGKLDRWGRRSGLQRAVKSFPINVDTAWLLGMYVAEGSASPNVRFSLGRHEGVLAARIIATSRRYGWNASVNHSPGLKSMSVNSGATVLARWLKESCGDGAKNKQIPQVILRNEDAQIRRAFLRGLVDGDGHRHKRKPGKQPRHMVSSSSERLIQDVALLLAQDGLGGSWKKQIYGPRWIGKTWTSATTIIYDFSWNPNGEAWSTRVLTGKIIRSKSSQWRASPEGVWYPLKSVEREDYKGLVYNLETPDHTYIVGGVLVHNCDYVINRWLVEMRLGRMPPLGLLYDRKYDRMSSEEIYASLATDLRRARKLAGFRGAGKGDMIGLGEPGDGARVTDGEAFVRGALLRGLELHHQRGRGDLPADLVEAIEAVAAEPVAWDAALAEWFQQIFPPLQRERSYARASRRQYSTPDIPRPGRADRASQLSSRTFTVLLDTSASMRRAELSQALGCIVSYAIAHEVPAVRLIECDAQPYDRGWQAVESLSGQVEVHGRGGTWLQPGLDLLEELEELPPDAPVMIITDGWYEQELNTRREHCYLLPATGVMQWPAHGPIFRME